MHQTDDKFTVSEMIEHLSEYDPSDRVGYTSKLQSTTFEDIEYVELVLNSEDEDGYPVQFTKNTLTVEDVLKTLYTFDQSLYVVMYDDFYEELEFVTYTTGGIDDIEFNCGED